MQSQAEGDEVGKMRFLSVVQKFLRADVKTAEDGITVASVEGEKRQTAEMRPEPETTPVSEKMLFDKRPEHRQGLGQISHPVPVLHFFPVVQFNKHDGKRVFMAGMNIVPALHDGNIPGSIGLS